MKVRGLCEWRIILNSYLVKRSYDIWNHLGSKVKYHKTVVFCVHYSDKEYVCICIKIKKRIFHIFSLTACLGNMLDDCFT